MNQRLTVSQAMKSEKVSFNAFFNALFENELGYWDEVNSTDMIREYINEKMKDGVPVSHILEAIEKEESKNDLWRIWLGNSMETPWPINTKKDLADALGLSGGCFRRKLDFVVN